MKLLETTIKRFIQEAGKVPAECVGRHPTGSTWLCRDGTVVAEFYDGNAGRFRYYVLGED